MTVVLVFGAGGPAANSFINALRLADDYRIIAANTDPTDLRLADADEYKLVGPTDNDLWRVLDETNPDFVHAQPDEEVLRLSRLRHIVRGYGVRYLLPRHEVVTLCQDKWLTYEKLRDAGVAVPYTLLPEAEKDYWQSAACWMRPRWGAGGKGSLKLEAGAPWWSPPDGTWTLAEYLPGPTITVQQLYRDGDLYISQGRARHAWTHGDRGSCRIGQTVSDDEADLIAYDAVKAVDPKPHGVYGVDMTRDAEGHPRVTEINIGRFFTTIPHFFAEAGVNIADMYVRLGLGQSVERRGRNPLPSGLKWVRQWDRPPLLIPKKGEAHAFDRGAAAVAAS